MLRMMVDKQGIVVLMGVFAALGIISKIVVNVTLKRMVRAAESMSKSTHPLMRLMRAKFEHACMVSEKVENVDVFVDKYLYEYRVCGLRLHSIQRLEKLSVALCVLLGALGAGLSYNLYGVTEQVFRFMGIGAALGIFVFAFQMTTDETYRMKVARNYMVDYLQNVCLHRYQKAYQKELAMEDEMEEAKEPLFPEEEPNLQGDARIVSVSDASMDPALESVFGPDTKKSFDLEPNWHSNQAKNQDFGSNSQGSPSMDPSLQQSVGPNLGKQQDLGPNASQKLNLQQGFGSNQSLKSNSEPNPQQNSQSNPQQNLQSTLQHTSQKAIEKETENEDKAVRIRQILEEFMA